MIKKEKYFGAKKVAAVALCVLFAISAIVVSSIIAICLANAEDVLPIDPSLNAFYDVGDTVDIPNIGLGEDGKTEASPRVYYPDGSVTVGNDCYVSMAGEYTVVYGATADGKHYDLLRAVRGGAPRRYSPRDIAFGYDNLHTPSGEFVALLREEAEKCRARLAAAGKPVPAVEERLRELTEVIHEVTRGL